MGAANALAVEVGLSGNADLREAEGDWYRGLNALGAPLLVLTALLVVALPVEAVDYQKRDGSTTALLCANTESAGCPVSGAAHPFAGSSPAPGADLTSADLASAGLAGADLEGATLASASLVSADLTDATLAGADLSGADLGQATLDGLLATGLQGCPAALPGGWGCVTDDLVGPGADLTNADLADGDLSGLDLQGTDLSTATLDRIRAVGLLACPAALPVGWLCANENLVGAGADLAGADLSGVDLSGFDVSFADLRGAKLSDATLSGTDFTSSDLGSADFTNADLSGAIFIQSDLESADLTQANLAGADLTRATLRFATISGADLTAVDLTDCWVIDLVVNSAVTLSNLDALVATSSGYVIAGPSVDLANANLAGLDLSNLNLDRANFFGANLGTTNFSGADLEAARNLPSYTPGSQSAPRYSASTLFLGFDPVVAGWQLLAPSVPSLGPWAVGILVALVMTAPLLRKTRS